MTLSMAKTNKENGIWGQIASAVIIAALVGGSAPWWWNKLFDEPNAIPVEEPTREITAKQPTGELDKKTVRVNERQWRVELSRGLSESDELRGRIVLESTEKEIRAQILVLYEVSKDNFEDIGRVPSNIVYQAEDDFVICNSPFPINQDGNQILGLKLDCKDGQKYCSYKRETSQSYVIYLHEFSLDIAKGANRC